MEHMYFIRLSLEFCVGTIYGNGYRLLFPMGVQVLELLEFSLENLRNSIIIRI